MSAATSPKPDAPVAAVTAQQILWVLVQEEPRVAVLAISADRDRIVREARELAAIQHDARDPVHHRWLIKPCDRMLV